MADWQGYASPAAFRRALTDRLTNAATESRWTLQELQRQMAYDRLLERLYLVDQGWIVKGATALLARDIGVLLPGLTAWTRLHGITSLEIEGVFTQMGIDPTRLYTTEIDHLIAQPGACLASEQKCGGSVSGSSTLEPSWSGQEQLSAWAPAR